MAIINSLGSRLVNSDSYSKWWRGIPKINVILKRVKGWPSLDKCKHRHLTLKFFPVAKWPSEIKNMISIFPSNSYL